ncbi:MAG TPA: hypothetical protein VFI47_18615 [Acidimicrobiales bacterium]|nr:hypothetical protein [Acidimicrobiales bacterium]
MALERTAIPREFSDPRRFTRRFRVIVACVAFAAVSGPIGCVAAVANRPDETPPPAQPRHQDYATVVAQSYLAGEPLPVPVARGLGADAGRAPLAPAGTIGDDEARPAPIPHTWLIAMGAEVTTLPAAETGDAAGRGRTVETHRFLVGTAQGPFVLAVPLVETAGSGPALGALPSLEPFVPDAAAAAIDPLDWSAVYDTRRASATLRERIAEWARAFAEDDRRRLLEITGDSRNGVEYVGLGAWRTAGEPEVGGLYARGDGAVGVHVELALTAADDPAVSTRLAFDLLVRHAGDPLPEIVAWGPAGSALTLAAYENASPVAGEPGAAATPTTTMTTTATSTTTGGAGGAS